MNYQLDYISRLFEKTSKKRLENYVISRLWHKLDNPEIKFVPQQYVSRNNKKYALTDLYLPQIKLHIEINEPAHYLSPERIEIDNKRKSEIEKRTNHQVKIVDCRKELPELHKDIDLLVEYINQKVAEYKKQNNFRAWETDNEFSPQYHKSKGILKIEEEPGFRTIEDICELFSVKVPKRGFLRAGGVKHPTDENLFIWWPVDKNKNWENEIIENDTIIIERNKDMEKRKNHVNSCLNSPANRIVFYRNLDILGFNFYRFKGIFTLDIEKSSPEKGVVWRRIEDKLKI